jgi:septal ring factor EnvC (AmiA/AmiB activator)
LPPSSAEDLHRTVLVFLNAAVALVDCLANFKLPKDVRWILVLRTGMQHALAHVDRVQTAARASEARISFQRSRDGDKLSRVAKERDDAARRVREEKKKHDDAMLQAMDREKRRKMEEKQRKEALTKAIPRMKFKSM